MQLCVVTDYNVTSTGTCGLWGVYLQLAIRREHTCLSSGYSFRFMGHDRVNDILHNKLTNIWQNGVVCQTLLTTGHPQWADLAVQRVQFEIHRARQCQRYSAHKQDPISISSPLYPTSTSYLSAVLHCYGELVQAMFTLEWWRYTHTTLMQYSSILTTRSLELWNVKGAVISC